MATTGQLPDYPSGMAEHAESKKRIFGQLAPNNSQRVRRCLFPPREDNNGQPIANGQPIG